MLPVILVFLEIKSIVMENKLLYDFKHKCSLTYGQLYIHFSNKCLVNALLIEDVVHMPSIVNTLKRDSFSQFMQLNGNDVSTFNRLLVLHIICRHYVIDLAIMCSNQKQFSCEYSHKHLHKSFKTHIYVRANTACVRDAPVRKHSALKQS